MAKGYFKSGAINLESFQATPSRSRSDKPRALASIAPEPGESTYSLHKPQHSGTDHPIAFELAFRLGLGFGWSALGTTAKTPVKIHYQGVRPMTMETRCYEVFYPNYSKKTPAEDTVVPPQWGTREKNVCFCRIIGSRRCTRRDMRFHVENCQHADQKQLTRR